MADLLRAGAAVVAHGGGPTPVINASLAGVIVGAREHFSQLYGARQGVEGLLAESFIDLLDQPADLVERIALAPGSVLGSCRMTVKPEHYERVLEVFRKRDVRWFFYNGGNGSMYLAQQVGLAARAAGYELQVIGIPKTIDNDIAETDHTPGYASCARFFAHAVRDIGADLRALRGRVTFVETLGRNAGWIVAATALARCAEDDAPQLVYLPERPISEDQLCADVERVFSRLGWAVVAVCEGQVNDKGEPFGADQFAPDGFARTLSGNLAHTLAQLVARRTGIRTRSEKPGLLGRSSVAYVTAMDRDEARLCGLAAVRAAVAGESGKMVTLIREPGQEYCVTTGLAPLEKVAYDERLLPESWIEPAGNGVVPAFLDWVRPLVGEVAPHARFA
ncbi:MAG TPA: diphosphate--fructose-6-phosphate 1-phosphotransferase [Bryobacteraceae bacterium]|nr:diphosphate--fructose-6-phosphate 1-phosphotransferase [Bryobacteraceae bacterium]